MQTTRASLEMPGIVISLQITGNLRDKMCLMASAISPGRQPPFHSPRVESESGRDALGWVPEGAAPPAGFIKGGIFIKSKSTPHACLSNAIKISPEVKSRAPELCTAIRHRPEALQLF